MRTSVRIATGISGGVLALALTACGSGSDQDGSTAPSGSTAANQTAPAVTALPQTGGMPNEPVCQGIPKGDVEQAIGKKVYSASNADILSGTEQPTLCNYYTDTDQVEGVKIQWQTPEDAKWSDYFENLGTSTGGDTVRTRVSGLGDGAYKEAGEIDGVKAFGYNVLLKDRGIVLSVYDTSGLPDATVLNLTKAALQAVDKL